MIEWSAVVPADGDPAGMTDSSSSFSSFTLSDILNGSAVCVYRMEDVVRAFKGNFLHKEGPQYKWAEFTGKVPYPRPGTVSWNFPFACLFFTYTPR